MEKAYDSLRSHPGHYFKRYAAITAKTRYLITELFCVSNMKPAPTSGLTIEVRSSTFKLRSLTKTNNLVVRPNFVQGPCWEFWRLSLRVSRVPHGGRGFRSAQYLFLRCYCFETSREADGRNKARRPSKIRLLERGATS